MYAIDRTSPKKKEAISVMLIARSHAKLSIAACISLCLITGPLVPGIALACEGEAEEVAWLSRENVGGAERRGEPYCEFVRVNERCQIRFRNITARTLKVTSATGAKILGTEGTTRYRKTVENCVFNLGMGECTDEIEVIRFVARTVNDYCLEVTDQGTNEHGQTCAALIM
jgi:hypothetical protein